MPQIMQGPVRPQRRVGAGEHQPGRVITQRPPRPPQRPPQRLIPASGHQPPDLLLIQPQPHERVRRGGQLLQRTRPLADHGDQLLPRIGIAGRCAQQLRCPGTRRHPERDQGQPSADELVGVGAVDLRAGRAAGGAAGFAGDRQDAAGFVDGGVAVDQFAGAAVDVVGAAAQQNRLQAPSGVPDGTCGDRGGQRRYSSRRGGRAEARSSQADTGSGSLISGAVPHAGPGQEWPAAQACHVVACAP